MKVLIGHVWVDVKYVKKVSIDQGTLDDKYVKEVIDQGRLNVKHVMEVLIDEWELIFDMWRKS